MAGTLGVAERGSLDITPPYYGPAPAVTFPLRGLNTPKPSEWNRNKREMETPLPSVCVLHGEPGTPTYRKWIPSHPHIPWDDYPLWRKVAHEIFRRRSNNAHSQRRALRIRVESRWTLCQSCRQYIRRRRMVSLALFAMVAVIITGPISPLTEWVPEFFRAASLIGGIALAIPAIRSLSNELEITRALVSEDGTALLVHNPHPEFARKAIELGAQLQSDVALPTNIFGLRPLL